MGRAVGAGAGESCPARAAHRPLIVSFHGYLSALAARDAISAALRGSGARWRIGPHRRHAVRESDFATLHVYSGRARVERLLRRHRAVAHVADERRHTCELLATAPPPSHAATGAARGAPTRRAAEALQAEAAWSRGAQGAGVRVAVFDSGLRESVRSIRAEGCINWTDEPSCDDGVGHGTFVAGLIGSTESECGGVAPEARLLVYKVSRCMQRITRALHRRELRLHLLHIPVRSGTSGVRRRSALAHLVAARRSQSRDRIARRRDQSLGGAYVHA